MVIVDRPGRPRLHSFAWTGTRGICMWTTAVYQPVRDDLAELLTFGTVSAALVIRFEVETFSVPQDRSWIFGKVLYFRRHLLPSHGPRVLFDLQTVEKHQSFARPGVGGGGWHEPIRNKNDCRCTCSDIPSGCTWPCSCSIFSRWMVISNPLYSSRISL
jgi:hypothetical protein